MGPLKLITSKRRKLLYPNEPAATAEASDDDLKVRLGMLDDKLHRISGKYERLQKESQDKDAEIARLKRKIAVGNSDFVHLTDDALARELKDLFHDLYSWSMRTRKDLRCGRSRSLANNKPY